MNHTCHICLGKKNNHWSVICILHNMYIVHVCTDVHCPTYNLNLSFKNWVCHGWSQKQLYLSRCCVLKSQTYTLLHLLQSWQTWSWIFMQIVIHPTIGIVVLRAAGVNMEAHVRLPKVINNYWSEGGMVVWWSWGQCPHDPRHRVVWGAADRTVNIVYIVDVVSHW